MHIFGDIVSGNCLKVKYTADYLGLAYKWHAVDVLKGESRTSDFLSISDMGQVPVLLLDDGRALAQSNAIIRYLAAGSSLMPADAFEQAKVDEMLFWEQYSHEPYVAVCRFHMAYLKKSKAEREEWRVRRGEAALDFMEKRLSGRTWFVGKHITVADVSLLAYTRLADEGGFDLSSRPQVCGWIERCEKELQLPARQREVV